MPPPQESADAHGQSYCQLSVATNKILNGDSPLLFVGPGKVLPDHGLEGLHILCSHHRAGIVIAIGGRRCGLVAAICHGCQGWGQRHKGHGRGCAGVAFRGGMLIPIEQE